jgi:hypothetical protein
LDNATTIHKLLHSAFVGTDSFPEGFFENLRSFSRREFPVFKTRDEALAWLAKD